MFASLRANGSRECAPDDRLREAIQRRRKQELDCFVASLLAMTVLPHVLPSPFGARRARGEPRSMRTQVHAAILRDAAQKCAVPQDDGEDGSSPSLACGARRGEARPANAEDETSAVLALTRRCAPTLGSSPRAGSLRAKSGERLSQRRVRRGATRKQPLERSAGGAPFHEILADRSFDDGAYFGGSSRANPPVFASH
jgi:hypothetical protein